MKKRILLLLIVLANLMQFAQAQVALTGSSVTTTGTILGWRGTAIASGHTVNGVINRYYPVTAYTAATGGTCAIPTSPASMTVGSGYGAPAPALAAGMEVLIIQMTASTSTGVIDRTTTSSSYGDVSNLGGGGNYEFAYIASISGSDVFFTKELVNTYDPINAKVQLIPTNPEGTVAPNAANYTTSNILRAMEYDEINGVGGVFVLSTTGTLTLSHNIDVDTLGFAGGDTIGVHSTTHIQNACCIQYTSGGSSQMDGTAGTGNTVLYAFPLVLTEARNAACSNTSNSIVDGARKGRGIFGVFTGEQLSKGKIANGAGGAHGYNSGGGGGGGYLGGGQGGNEHAWSCNQSNGANNNGLDNGGIGGLGLNGGSTALFMGGGGGAGQGNGTNASTFSAGTYLGGTYRGPSKGGDGGGIIIIKANQISASGQTISAKGQTARYSISDGAGGGGGGGSIILEVPTYSGTLTVDVSGGGGGHSINPGGSNDCHGPGGGGGGGRIILSVGSAPAGVTLNSNGGATGILLQNSNPLIAKVSNLCGAGTASGAVAGTSTTPTFSTPINTQTCVPLPVTLLNFYAELLSDNTIGVFWNTATEVNASHFVIERSSDGVNFEQAGIVRAHGNSQQVINYSFTDEEVFTFSGTVYYRLCMVDLDGTIEYSKVAGVVLKGAVVSIYPNPVKESQELHLVYFSYVESEEISISLFNMLGIAVYTSKESLQTGSNTITIHTNGLAAGAYLVEISDNYSKSVQKLFIE